MQTAGSVQQNHVRAGLPGLGNGLFGNIDRLHPGNRAITGHFQLAGKYLELLDGRWPIDVGRHKIGIFPVLAQKIGQLGRGSRLARTLKTDEHDYGGFVSPKIKFCSLAPQKLNKFVMNCLYYLLGRTDALEHFLAKTFIAHIVDKIPDHIVIDIGFQKRKAHLPESGLHIFFRKPGHRAKITKNAG